MRLSISLLTLLLCAILPAVSFAAAPAKTKPKEIVAEYIGLYGGQGYYEHHFITPKGKAYMLLFCEDADPDCSNEFCNSCPNDEDQTRQKQKKQFEAIRSIDGMNNIGHQMIITVKKIEEDIDKDQCCTEILAENVKIDPKKNAPKYTKISARKTVIGRVKYYRKGLDGYTILTTTKGKKFKIDMEPGIRRWLDPEERCVFSGCAPKNEYYILTGRFHRWYNPAVFFVEELPKVYIPKR